MATDPHQAEEQHLELPVVEVLRRATPHPAPEELVIHDLTDDEVEAFWTAISDL